MDRFAATERYKKYLRPPQIGDTYLLCDRYLSIRQIEFEFGRRLELSKEKFDLPTGGVTVLEFSKLQQQNSYKQYRVKLLDLSTGMRFFAFIFPDVDELLG